MGLLLFLLFLIIYVCGGVHLSAGAAEARDLGSPRDGVAGGCELPGLHAGPSGGAAHALDL